MSASDRANVDSDDEDDDDDDDYNDVDDDDEEDDDDDDSGAIQLVSISYVHKTLFKRISWTYVYYAFTANHQVYIKCTLSKQYVN